MSYAAFKLGLRGHLVATVSNDGAYAMCGRFLPFVVAEVNAARTKWHRVRTMPASVEVDAASCGTCRNAEFRERRARKPGWWAR